MTKYDNRLYELRGGMSQKKFAESIGLTQQNYANYENGKQGLKSDLIRRICETYGCSAEWLLGFDPIPVKRPNDILSDEEQRLLHLYRNADSRSRHDALALLASHQKSGVDSISESA